MVLKIKKIIEKIINILLNVLIFIFGLVLLISIYTSVQTKILKKDYTDFFGYSLFEVQTGSMSDTINAGDWIVVRLTKKIKLNDVITYELNGEYITHRVIEVYNNNYITKGDANNAKDNPINQNQILGKVVFILGNLGIIRNILFNPSVLVALIITLFLFNIAFKKDMKGFIKRIVLFFKNLKNFKISEYFKGVIEKIISLIKKVKITKKEIDNSPAVQIKTLESHEKVYDLSEFENDEEYEEDELEKTSLYRVISVDATEVDNTFLEIAKNEMQLEKNEIIQEEPQEEVISEEENDDLTSISLDMLNNKKQKKSKNIIDTLINIKKEELSELTEILIYDKLKLSNSSTINNEFINIYINAKYYNCFDGQIDNNKNSISKIEKIIKETTQKLINSRFNDDKYKLAVNIYDKVFMLIVALDQAKESISDSKAKRKFYKKEIIKYFKDWKHQRVEDVIDDVIQVQRKYTDVLEYFLKKLETNMFVLKFNPLVTKKDIFGLDLQHNISFNRVYSDYIIDKTYTEGIVAEDKISVLLTLLLSQVTKDMVLSDFNKKYLLYLPNSLYKKEKKLAQFLRMFDDKHARNSIVILITFKDLLRHKSIIKRIRRMDYKFALVFNTETTVEETERGYLYISSYIFINKKIPNISKILSAIPEELLDNVIYEDITDKVGDLESE